MKQDHADYYTRRRDQAYAAAAAATCDVAKAAHLAFATSYAERLIAIGHNQRAAA